jgi:hypothetical protein
MTEDEIQFAKSRIDKAPVKIFMPNGKHITAKILSVSDAEEDLICDVITDESGRPGNKKQALLLRFDEIDSVPAA